MSDRLNELRRQRDAIRGHLEWLEREIAAAAGGEAPAKNPAPARTNPAPTKWSAPPSPFAKPTSAPATGDPDALLAKYGEVSGNVHQDVKKGCFLYFALAFVILGIAVAVLYWHTFHKR